MTDFKKKLAELTEQGITNWRIVSWDSETFAIVIGTNQYYFYKFLTEEVTTPKFPV